MSNNFFPQNPAAPSLSPSEIAFDRLFQSQQSRQTLRSMRPIQPLQSNPNATPNPVTQNPSTPLAAALTAPLASDSPRHENTRLYSPWQQPQQSQQPLFAPPSAYSSTDDFTNSTHSSVSSISRDPTSRDAVSSSTSFSCMSRRPSCLADSFIASTGKQDYQAHVKPFPQRRLSSYGQHPPFLQSSGSSSSAGSSNSLYSSLPPRQHSFPFSSAQLPAQQPQNYTGLRNNSVDASFLSTARSSFKVPDMADVSEIPVFQTQQTQESPLNYTGVFYPRPNSVPVASNSTQPAATNQQPASQSSAATVIPSNNTFVALDDGLLLDRLTNTIVASPELRVQFAQCSSYFGDFETSLAVVDSINLLLGREVPAAAKRVQKDVGIPLKTLQRRTSKLLLFLLTQNEDLRSSSHSMASKNYSLILNKNGRLDIISFPKKSNLQLSRKDIIIIEGDRGKDLVMVLEPVVEFRFALFFNYLKKKLHLKSLEFGNSGSSSSNSRRRKGSSNKKTLRHNRSIINEDENFITLPNKQILRFAKPRELVQLLAKYNDELVALKICINYAASLHLNLIIKNVEFQFDKKKLIIYYYCLQRLDFRGLIKELFKIYKTRIWLCAILPLEGGAKPLLDYEMDVKGIKREDTCKAKNSSTTTTNNTNNNNNGNYSYRSAANVVKDQLPAADQIYNLGEITHPLSYHSKIFSSLIDMFNFEISHLDLFKDRYWFLDGEI